jgi:hypothetical protein
MIDRKESSLRDVLPSALKHIIENQLLPNYDPQKVLVRLMRTERLLLDIIDNGDVVSLAPDFRHGAVNSLEVVRVVKRKLARQLGISAQNEALYL